MNFTIFDQYYNPHVQMYVVPLRLYWQYIITIGCYSVFEGVPMMYFNGIPVKPDDDLLLEENLAKREV